MRWHIKKASRFAVATAGCLGRMRIAARNKPTVRVLTYHRIGETKRDPFCVDTRVFSEQMRLLASEQRAVSLGQLIEFVAGRTKLPVDACLVTIDDGMLSTLTHALPVLAQWQVPAVAFVSSSLIGRTFKVAGERYMDWSELRELAASKVVSIGSHAHSHRSLGLMPASEAREEAMKSREVIQQQLGEPVESFAYPFGTRTDFNSASEQALREAGYSIAFHSMHGAIRPGMNPLSLPRAKIEGGEPVFLFSIISRGGLDAWRLVDHNLWRLQRVRTEIR